MKALSFGINIEARMKFLNIVFRILRRGELKLDSFKNKFFIFKYNSLYGTRIAFGRNIKMGKGFTIRFDASLSKISIGDGAQFRDYCNIFSGANARVVVGKNAFFNNHCSINCLDSITIGDNCQFGEGVKLYDHNHQFEDVTKLINEQGYKLGEIFIGDNCWLGSNVIILKNVHIGNNVIIGAGCVIHRSIPANTVIINRQELIIKDINVIG